MSDTKIRNVYEMMFPYGFYNEQLGETCYIIDRELKVLCRDNARHILLMIGRYFGHVYTPDTPTVNICQDIQNDIRVLCLGGLPDERPKRYRNEPTRLSDLEVSKYIIGLKTGLVDVASPLNTPLSSDDRLICRELRLGGMLNDEVIDSIDTIINNNTVNYPGDGFRFEGMYWLHMYKYARSGAEHDRERLLNPRRRRDPRPNPENVASVESLYQKRLDDIPSQYLELISAGKYNELFRMDYNQWKEFFTKEIFMSSYDEEGRKYYLTKPSHADFLLRLVDMILADKIQVATGSPEEYRLLRWTDIC